MAKKKASRFQKRVLTAIMIIAIGVFLWSSYELITGYMEYSASRSEYDDLREEFRKTGE